MAPVWTAANRFVIVRDETQPFFSANQRVRRMVLVTFALSLIPMVAGLPRAGAPRWPWPFSAPPG
jgi:hypothetical protein